MRQSRPGQPEFYNLTQAARICGVSYPFLVRLTRKGEFPATKHPLNGKPVIGRQRFLRFLREAGYPEEIYRPYFQPEQGRLLVCGATKDLHWTQLVSCVPTFCRSLYALGRRVSSEPCWGIVLDFAGLGRDAGMSTADEIRESGDHPLLVALTTEDEPVMEQRAASKFDLILGRPLEAARVAKGLNVLRRSVVAASPRIADGGGQFRKVGKRV